MKNETTSFRRVCRGSVIFDHPPIAAASESDDSSGSGEGVDYILTDIPASQQAKEEAERNYSLAVAPTDSLLVDDSEGQAVEPLSDYVTHYRLANKSVKKSQKGPQFASCTILKKGGKCSIEKGRTLTRTINLSLGATRNWAAGQLGISSANTTTTTVSCHSPAMKKGEIWRGYSMGSRHKYKVKKLTYYKGRDLVDTKTSGWLYAFNPYRNSIACG